MPNLGMSGFPSSDYNQVVILDDPIFPLTLPPLDNWVWINQGLAILSTAGNFINIYAPALAGDNLKAYLRAVPPKPYNLDVIVSIQMENIATVNAGLCWYDAITGKFAAFQICYLNYGPSIQSYKYTNKNNPLGPYNSILLVLSQANFWRVRLHDDDINRQVYYSIDSLNWVLFQTIATNDFLTPTHIGIYANANNANYPASITLWSWKEN